jgi:hypothetical protein
VSSTTFGHLYLTVSGTPLFTEVFGGRIDIGITKPILTFFVDMNPYRP